MSLQITKEVLLIASLVVSLIVVVFNWFGVFVLVRYQLAELKHVITNSNGLVQRTERIEKDITVIRAICDERHSG